MTSNEVEIARRMRSAHPSFDRRVVGLIKHVPFISRHFIIAAYNFLLRKIIRRRYVAITYFEAEMKCGFNDYIEVRILHFGFWEPNISWLIESILKTGDIFVDIGANIGYFSLLGSKLVGPQGFVIAIEASPSTCELLAAHINENNASNVRIVNKAASDVPGSQILYRASPGNIGTATTIRSHGYGEKV